MKIRAVGAELVHADAQTDMTKLTVACFLQFWEHAEKRYLFGRWLFGFPARGQGSVTDPPVSRALSSLQRLIVQLVDIGMQRVRSSKCRTAVRTCHYRQHQNRESRGITLHAVGLQMLPDNEHN
jgi:hypothetical protein